MEEQEPILLHLPRNKKIDIEFNNISYTALQSRKEKKRILKGVSGKFRSGELTAIMGPSGAGKTSLLNVLTGFQTTGLTGSIKSNSSKSHKVGTRQYKKEACYILQDDQLVPFFTVGEAMMIAADLKLGNNVTLKAKEFVIEDILDTLSLSSCKNTRCGQLSGGQKKRLSIALELIDNPPIMFLDEPTTGLDSLSSLQCITMLKGLARGGRTIVCTIHQPSATIYELFDHVYVLAQGLCVYQGASVNTIAYLSSVGLNCPEYYNPADYLLDVANGDYGNFTDQLAKVSGELNWRSVFTSRGEKEENDGSIKSVEKTPVIFAAPSELSKFPILLKRSFLQLYRDWTVSQLKFLLHALIGVVIGVLYLDVGNDGSKTTMNFGYLLVTLAYLCYTSLIPAVVKFPSELPVLRKEKFNNWYNLKTYYVAFLAVDIPLQALFCSTYTTISYFMSAQPQEWSRFLMFLWIAILLTVTAESVGILLGTLVNPVNGTFLGAISIAFMLSLSGFLIFLSHMSTPFYVTSYVSYLRYALQGLVHAVYGFGRDPLPCPEEATYCHYTRPAVFLKEIGMAENSYWFSTGMLCLFIVVLRITGFFTLKRVLSKGA